MGSKNCYSLSSNSRRNLYMGLLFGEIKVQVRYFQNHSRLDLDYWFYRAIISGGTLSPNAAIFSIHSGELFFRVKKTELFWQSITPREKL
jgi:hypothetical protein